MNETTLLVIHFAATAFMTGLIWFVQVVHYPLFQSVGREGFIRYERLHASRTTRVVGPAMLIEAGAALWLAMRDPGAALPLVGAVLLGAIWMSTAFLQVPLHKRLLRGYDADAARALVRTNWIRTLGWSARCVIAARMLAA